MARLRKKNFKSLGGKRGTIHGNFKKPASFKESNALPVIKIAGIVLSFAAVVCVVVFVILPMFNGEYLQKPSSAPVKTITPIYSAPPAMLGRPDMSELAHEILLDEKSINTPDIFKSTIVYTTGDKKQLNPTLDVIALYDLEAKQASILDSITMKYNNLLFCKISEKWIVYLDINSRGGGSICGYNRQTSETFVIRDFYYSMPKLSLDGDYLAWITQTAPNVDKLYLCYLPENETVTVKVFNDIPSALNGCDMRNGELIWTEPATESKSGLFPCKIMRMQIRENGETNSYEPSVYVYNPTTNGKDIAFLDGNRSPEANLMLSVNGAPPKLIIKGVLNYAIGKNFVAYTKDDLVKLYFWEDESTGCVNGKNLKGELAAVKDTTVLWYDVTDGLTERDVLKYAVIQPNKNQGE